MESLVLSPGGSQPRLNTWPNCSFSLSQEWSLSQTVWNFMVSSNEVIGLRDPTRPPKKDEIILFLVPAAFCLQKPSISYSSSKFFLLARWDEAQFLNGWRTPVLSLSSWVLFLNTTQPQRMQHRPQRQTPGPAFPAILPISRLITKVHSVSLTQGHTT